MAFDFGAALSSLAKSTPIGGVLGAVSTGLSGGSGKGLVGGTVTRTGGGLIFIKTASGKEVAIKRRRSSRRRGHSGGMTMNQFMKFRMLERSLK